ncbi:MAG: tetratricopeptide repeat protein [Rhizobacter sp.]|nr:tetratricopeptide repeat protein [Burkholderiaceae bacterium]MCO5122883.1 tetratricopeptide repeat protein [Rhizobacter sp.]
MSDVRALLLTDVVDSTKLSEVMGDEEMADLWAAHDRVARDLVQEKRGREIDKTDGMLIMFDHAADAVAYAIAYHAALRTLPVPLKARAGLHVGAVILRENSAEDVALGAKLLEVDGLAKPTAARVMSLARGGQTLLTREAREDLGKTELKVESHGHWQIKGVVDPIELFEVGDPEARMQQPPDSDKVYRVVRAGEWWMPVKDIPNNLPHQGTSFVGREKELGEVKSYLEKARLITLLGMGGLGKTRLSLEVAAELLHAFPDGVWFLDLAPLRDAELVFTEAAQALGVHEEPDKPLLQTLCAHLKQRRALLILDNCEHLIKASADLAAAVLKAAPHVRLLTSSREALRVPGEQCYPVRPLPVPGKGAGIEALMKSTAVRLFVERAQQHKPSFSLNEKEAPAVAELVARLEGIPLALELAAARVRALTVAEINNRLKDRYKILTGGARVLQERQQTLRALVDWSYDLLGEPEQCVLARLSVFAGGFDLNAAEAVCGAEPLEIDDVLDILGSLVEKSLVMLEERDDAGRYRMLETIRDYASEKLSLTAESDAVAARHCEHYFAETKEANHGMMGPDQAEWIQRIEADLDNVRAATACALAGSVDPVIVVKMAVAMQGFWTLRGYATEGRNVVRAALALPAIQSSDIAHAWALYVGAALAESQSDHAEARQMLELCLTLRRRLGNPNDIAATLSTLSLARLQAGDAAGALETEHEALQIFRDLGDRSGEAIGLIHLGQIRAYMGDTDRAREHLEECMSVARGLKHQEIEGECQLLLGEVAFDVGDWEQAVLWFKRSLTVCREAADKRGEANALRWLGKTELEAGDLASARARLDEAVREFRAFEMWEELLGGLDDLAALIHREGPADLAVRILAAAAMARKRLRLVLSPRTEERAQALTAALRDSLTVPVYESHWNDGCEWEIDHAIELALSPKLARVTA